MNRRLQRFGFVIILAFAILSMASVAGMALDRSVLDVSLAPDSQAGPTSTPTAQQSSRYSQYIRSKQTQTPAASSPTQAPATAPTTTPESTPDPEAGSVAAASSSGEANALIDDNRLQKVIGHRLSATLYGFGGDDTLYRSDNDGASWNQVAAESEILDFIVSPADPMVLYSGVGVDCGTSGTETEPTIPQAFYRSSDGGESWERLALGDNLRPLLTDPQDADRLMAADCALPYLSANGGDSWQSKPDRSAAALWDTYRMLEIGVSSLVGVSSAKDAHWHYLYASGADEDQAGVIVYSGDEGGTWERITPRIRPQPSGISSVTADPTTAGRLWFTDRNGVWYTEDFGTSWQLTILGLADALNAGDRLDMTGLTDILYLPNGDIYLATIEGLYRGKPDSGIWTLVEDGEFGIQRVDSLILTESQPDRLWVNAADGVYVYPVK
jgi:hypothetical protein